MTGKPLSFPSGFDRVFKLLGDSKQEICISILYQLLNYSSCLTICFDLFSYVFISGRTVPKQHILDRRLALMSRTTFDNHFSSLTVNVIVGMETMVK